ncbi:hypothetical protein ACFUTY_38490, partial [Streptomyces sp. NPDC057362]
SRAAGAARVGAAAPGQRRPASPTPRPHPRRVTGQPRAGGITRARTHVDAGARDPPRAPTRAG